MSAAGEAAARSGPRDALRPSQTLAVALGSGFEFYDFTVYSFFAAPIGRTFFPVASPWTSLTLSVATFGVGFVARPAGALFFGVYADRRGRRRAMLLAVALMALGTLGLALAPGHALLGWGGAAVAAAARLLQGFALGGEIGPSTAYLMETAPRDRRAFALSWPIALHGGAVLSAGLIGLALAAALPGAVYEAWGWRVAMLAGLGVVPAGLLLRARLPDGPLPPPRPILRPVLARPKAVAAAAVVVASGAVAFYVAAYLASYAGAVLKLPPATALLAAVASGTAMVIATPLAGRLADRVGRRPVFLASRLGFAALAVPGFAWLAARGDAGALVAVSAGLAALNALGAPPGLCLIAEAMPGAARATGLALAYTIGSSLFGGLSQPAATALIGWTGDALSPAYLLVAAGLVGAAGSFALLDAAPGAVSPPP